MPDLDFTRRLPKWDAGDLTLAIADRGLLLAFRGDYTPPVGRVPLAFGKSPGQDTAPREVTIAARLGPPSADIRLSLAITLRLAAQLAAPRLSIDARYDVNVYRGPSGYGSADWTDADEADTATAAPWHQSARRRAEPAALWEEAAAVATDRSLSAGRQIPRATGHAAPRWEEAKSLATVAPPILTIYAPAVRTAGAIPWDKLPRLNSGTTSRYTAPPRTGSSWAVPWGVLAGLIARAWGLPYVGAPWRTKGYDIPWEQAIWPPPGMSPPPYVPPVEPPDLYVPDLDLIFRCPPAAFPWILNFSDDPCGRGPRVVPIRRVYIVLDSASLVRVADNAEIPVQALALAIDTDSWAWSLRATLAGRAALALVRGTDEPVEVEAEINGYKWRALVDSWQVSRAWARGDYTITGRSRAASLASPYAAARTYTETAQRTAQQLAEQELPLGWTLDWQLPTWLVPAGAWSYSERTPIEAIATIAASAGGYLQPHRTDPKLIAAPRYPTPPWKWATATPDLTLPLDIITELGSDWQPRPEYNVVFVRGRDQGVLLRVHRDGTAGDIDAPMVVDPLITETAAGTARGTTILAAAGLQSRETLTLPLDDGLAGLLTPGQLLKVTDGATDWRGLIRGVSVRASLNGRNLSVRQAVDVERHYETEEAT